MEEIKTRPIGWQSGKKVETACTSIALVSKGIANEGSEGLYYVQEHLHRTATKFMSLREEHIKNTSRLKGASYDIGFALEASGGMKDIGVWNSIDRLLSGSLTRLSDSCDFQSANASMPPTPLADADADAVQAGEENDASVVPVQAGEESGADDLQAGEERQPQS